MATKRAKKQARKVRSRTAYRKAINRLHKMEMKLGDVSIPRNQPEYWYPIVRMVGLHNLSLLVEYMEITTGDHWEYRDSTICTREEVIKIVHMEQSLGLHDV